jgi:DNA-binding MarR family transcriptional regulator
MSRDGSGTPVAELVKMTRAADVRTPPVAQKRQLELTSTEIATDASLEQWSRLRDVGRRLNRELRALGSSFPQWRVLYATERLTREAGDCVSQVSVARRLRMDVNTVSNVMRRLEREGLVSRGPDSVAASWRVLVTAAGKRLLEDARGPVASFSLDLAMRLDEDE